jgi:tRNA-Thr(GGU) m(6)t(6)A37 methyltransferase TsaA
MKTMRTLFSILIGLFLCLAGSVPSFGGENQEGLQKSYTLYPIGQVEKDGGRTRIVLDKKYQPGLLGLDTYSHIYVLYWFNLNDTPAKRSILQVHPHGNKNNPVAGVFATRAPVRPNLIALSLCKIISLRDNVLEVDQIDAFPHTPVLDIKPYIPVIDTVP